MKVLVACEFSGIVREAFAKRGHEAWSCDLLPTEIPSERHLQCDVRELDLRYFDLMIAHPPCQYLAVSGARWFANRKREQTFALAFAIQLLDSCMPMLAIENPISVLSRIEKPSQIIQPWMFGHGEIKSTCLWLRGLPLLSPTDIVEGRYARCHREPPSRDRWKNRSRTYQGIADAMADQWGSLTI